MRITKTLGPVLAVLLLAGCCPNLNKDKIKSDLYKEMQVGDSREKIERVLKSHRIDFSYDEYQHRYQSNIRGENCAFDKSIILYVYVDTSMRMLKIETSDSYTFL